MNYTEDEHNQAKSDMLGEFNKAIIDAEDLRKAHLSDDAAPLAPATSVEQPASAGANPAGTSGLAAGTAGKTAVAGEDLRACRSVDTLLPPARTGVNAGGTPA